ncbi:hypothetical protein LPJ53_000946 [Coemansia erecta]|uniref:Uncharacterized protein n=1 Tax=Coemansia erecta TaxID=147472 RepID=A0A9W8CSN3_9FUNG|nr:hypothetical protein LPJ53_000946 [Coemansia erecta]
MKTLSIAVFAATIVSATHGAPIGLNIPGIINLELGSGNGLNLNVLGGLVHANVGGRGSRAKKPMEPPMAAVPPPPAAAMPVVPIVGRHF